jgi:NlpC/P60 family putative phage cell wall peptidase
MSVGRPQIVAEARRWIGTPYRHQASLLGVGCDCLGLVRGVWRAVVGPEPEDLPPYPPDWAEGSGRDALIQAADRHLVPVPEGGFGPGDVLVFRLSPHGAARHLGVAVSETAMVHAHDGAVVAEVSLAGWRRRIAGCWSFPGVAEPWAR